MDIDYFPLSDHLDSELLMHRDAHFGGKFSIMKEYYEKEGKGAQSDFSIERMEHLEKQEQASGGQNMAPYALTEVEAEKVGKAQAAYKSLRELYEKENTSPLALLIADLILAEEENPLSEMSAIIEKGEEIIPYLHEVIDRQELYDPLFPGYGLTPHLAITCIGEIGSPKSIPHLFRHIGKEGFSNEETILEALKKIGEPAKQFLLKQLVSQPIIRDNERAAIALLAFPPSEDIAQACLGLLIQADDDAPPILLLHLILGCEGLQRKEDRNAFRSLSLPSAFAADKDHILRCWE